MASKIGQLVIDYNGAIVDKINGYITATSEFANHIQVIAPFPNNDSVSINFYLRNARISTYTQYMTLQRDDSNVPLKGRDVISSSKEYYQAIKDWNVWLVPIGSLALAAISKWHSGTVDVSVSFRSFRNLSIEDTGTYIGTFGSRKSISGGDLPVIATIGDFYKCDYLDYYSDVADLEFTLGDLAIYTAEGWIKGTAYETRLTSSSTEFAVDPAIFGQRIESVRLDTTEMIIDRIAGLEAAVLSGAGGGSYADNLYIRNGINLNYPTQTSLPTDTIYLERDSNGYHITIEDIVKALPETDASIIRTTGTESPYTGSGFYAGNNIILLGSALGPGISWDGTNLFIRGTIQSGTITDPALLEQLKGETGTAGADGTDGTDGYSPVLGLDYFNGDNGYSWLYKGELSLLSTLALISEPQVNWAYKILETQEIWLWSGTQWLNMGKWKGDDGADGADGADGQDGSPAKYVAVSGEQAFTYASGLTIPRSTTITLTASIYGGLTTFDWEYWNGSDWTNLSGTQNTDTYTLSHNNVAWGSNTSLRIRCLSETYSDQITIVKLYDGLDVVSGYLTNENVSIPSTHGGTQFNLIGAGGFFKVFHGSTDVTTSATFSMPIVTKNGLSVNIYSSGNGEYFAYGDGWNTKFENFEMSATYNGVTITKIFTISKSIDGTDGSDPQYVVINGPTAFKYLDHSTTPTELFISLNAALFGGLTTYDWEYWNGSAWVDLGLDYFGGSQATNGYALSHDNAAWGTNTSLRVRCLSGTAYDEQTIVKLYDGIDGITGLLTNENITVPANADGTGYDLSLITGTFKIYEGITDVTSLASSTFSITSTNPSSGLTLSIGNLTGIYTASGASWVSDIESFTLSVLYKNMTITKVLTVSKARAGQVGATGADGTNGLDSEYVIINGRQTFKFQADEIEPEDTWTSLTAQLYGGLTTYDWEYYNGTIWTDLSGVQNQSTYTLDYTNAAWGTNNSLRVRCLSGTAFDEMTIVKLYDGATGIDAVSGFLTNENVTVAANNDGTGYNLSGTDGNFKVFQGITDVSGSAQYSPSTSEKNGLTLSIGPITGIYTLSGANWTSDVETFDLVATYNGITIDKKYTISKARQGSIGNDPQYVVINGPVAFKYLSDTTTPTVTSMTLTAQLYGGLTTYDWEYWNGSSWVDLSGTQNVSTYVLAHNNTAWGTNTSLRVRCLSGTAYDEQTILKLYDGNTGPQGGDGPAGTSIIIKGSVALVADLPSTGNTVGDLYIVDADGNGYVWNGTSWDNVGQIQGSPLYFHRAYANTSDGSGASFSITYFDAAIYEGYYTDSNLADSTTNTDYTWTRFLGEAALNGLLSNESVTVPSATDGTGYSLTTATGTFKLFKGTVDVTTSATFGVTTATKNGLTFTIDSVGTYTLSGASWTTDFENFEANATYNGTTISKIFTISKAKAGSNGIDGQDANYIILTGPRSFKFLKDQTVPTVTSIELSAFLYGNLTTYDWEYWNGTIWTNLSGTQNTNTYTLAHDNVAWGSNTILRVRCLSGTTSDEMTIVKLYDGATGIDSVNGYLTNENASFVSENDGTGYSLAGFTGTFKVYKGIVDVTTSATFSITSTNPSNGLTASIGASTGIYTLSGAAWTTDWESFTLQAVYNELTLTKVLTLTKAKRGVKGLDGADADYVIINSPGVFKYLSDTTLPSNLTITLTAQLFGSLSTYTWQYYNGSIWTNLSGVQDASTYSLSHDNAAWGANTELRVRCLSGVYYDEQTILKLYDGDTGPAGGDGSNGTSIVIKGTVATVGNLPSVSNTIGDLYIVEADGNGYVWNGATWDNVGQLQGAPLYFHRAYANTADGSGASFSITYFDGAIYEGYYTSSTPADSETNTDYTWTRFLGQDGTPALNSRLSNQPIIVGALSDGTGYSFVGQTGQFYVYSGATNVTASSTFTVTTPTKNGLTLSIGAATGIYTLSGASWTTDSETFELNATYNGTVLSEILTVAKQKSGSDGSDGSDGADGADGINSKWIEISGRNSYKFLKDATEPISVSLTLTATGYNTVGYNWEYSVNNGTNWTTLGNTTSTYNNTYDDPIWSTHTTIMIKCSDTIGTSWDIFTLTKLFDGATGINAVNGYLTNENMTFASNSIGQDYVTTGFSGAFKVYYGLLDVTASSTFSITSTNPTGGMTLSIGSSTGIYTLETDDNTWTTDTAQWSLRAVYGGATLDKVFTISKAKAGINGTNGTDGTDGTDGTNGTDGTDGTNGTNGTDGIDGPAGAGLVFRGAFNTATIYYSTSVRKDVVLYLTDYYSLKPEFNNATGPWVANEWDVMIGFASVATDLLLAQNATVTKGLVLGSSSNDTAAFMRSFSMDTLTSGNGFYLEGTGKLRLGNTAGNNLYWDGTNLSVVGQITATSGSFTGSITATGGSIGGWNVSSTKLSSGTEGANGNYAGLQPFLFKMENRISGQLRKQVLLDNDYLYVAGWDSTYGTGQGIYHTPTKIEYTHLTAGQTAALRFEYTGSGGGKARAYLDAITDLDKLSVGKYRTDTVTVTGGSVSSISIQTFMIQVDGLRCMTITTGSLTVGSDGGTASFIMPFDLNVSSTRASVQATIRRTSSAGSGVDTVYGSISGVSTDTVQLTHDWASSTQTRTIDFTIIGYTLTHI